MTSFCAVGNDKVVPPSHSGEEAVCMDHYGHLDGENTLTVSGKVGPSSRTQCELGSRSKKKQNKKKPRNKQHFQLLLFTDHANIHLCNLFLTVHRKTF